MAIHSLSQQIITDALDDIGIKYKIYSDSSVYIQSPNGEHYAMVSDDAEIIVLTYSKCYSSMDKTQFDLINPQSLPNLKSLLTI